mmetsp:Transcript_41351/g.69603  ORF Transcript_41351/g.69603 Transcript_41351/m.69603 type:complete len:219 (-) Transcript_41351:443-1099(-)
MTFRRVLRRRLGGVRRTRSSSCRRCSSSFSRSCSAFLRSSSCFSLSLCSRSSSSLSGLPPFFFASFLGSFFFRVLSSSRSSVAATVAGELSTSGVSALSRSSLVQCTAIMRSSQSPFRLPPVYRMFLYATAKDAATSSTGSLQWKLTTTSFLARGCTCPTIGDTPNSAAGTLHWNRTTSSVWFCRRNVRVFLAPTSQSPRDRAFSVLSSTSPNVRMSA